MSFVSDGVYVDRSYSTMNVAKSRSFGVFFAEEVGHKRLHARYVEHNAGGTVAD